MPIINRAVISQVARLSVKPYQVKKRLSVVMDLDECMVHSRSCASSDTKAFAERPDDVYLLDWTSGRLTMEKRPFLDEFLRRISEVADLYMFTAGMQVYAEVAAKCIDPEKKLFKHIWYRDSCYPFPIYELTKDPIYIKDLNVLGTVFKEHPSRVVLVDNSPYSFIAQPSSGIPIHSFYGVEETKDDDKLNFVADLIIQELEKETDVRPVLQSRFNLIAAVDKTGIRKRFLADINRKGLVDMNLYQ